MAPYATAPNAPAPPTAAAGPNFAALPKLRVLLAGSLDDRIRETSCMDDRFIPRSSPGVGDEADWSDIMLPVFFLPKNPVNRLDIGESSIFLAAYVSPVNAWSTLFLDALFLFLAQ